MRRIRQEHQGRQVNEIKVVTDEEGNVTEWQGQPAGQLRRQLT